MQYSGGRFSSDLSVGHAISAVRLGKYWKWVGRSLHVPVIPMCSQRQRSGSANHCPGPSAVRVEAMRRGNIHSDMSALVERCKAHTPKRAK